MDSIINQLFELYRAKGKQNSSKEFRHAWRL